MVAKDLNLASVTFGSYLNDKYALWLDMRTTDDDQLHGTDFGSRMLVRESRYCSPEKHAIAHQRSTQGTPFDCVPFQALK